MMRRLRLNVPLVIGLLLAALFVVMMILPSVLNLPDPHETKLTMMVDGKLLKAPYAPGEAGFILGSDRLGRDLLSRLIYGARYTLLLALAVSAVKAVLAIPLGLAAGWRRGWLGEALTGMSAAASALPSLVLVALILATLRRVLPFSRYWLYIYAVVIVIVGLPRLAEQVRRLTEHIATQPYIEGAVAVGARPWRILLRHVLPVMRSDLVVTLAADMAWVLVMMGQLAVLGVFIGGMRGMPLEGGGFVVVEHLPEWAQMMGANRDLIRRAEWWVPIWPGITLGLAVACFQLLAEGLRLRWMRR